MFETCFGMSTEIWNTLCIRKKNFFSYVIIQLALIFEIPIIFHNTSFKT